MMSLNLCPILAILARALIHEVRTHLGGLFLRHEHHHGLGAQLQLVVDGLHQLLFHGDSR